MKIRFFSSKETRTQRRPKDTKINTSLGKAEKATSRPQKGPEKSAHNHCQERKTGTRTDCKHYSDVPKTPRPEPSMWIQMKCWVNSAFSSGALHNSIEQLRLCRRSFIAARCAQLFQVTDSPQLEHAELNTVAEQNTTRLPVNLNETLQTNLNAHQARWIEHILLRVSKRANNSAILLMFAWSNWMSYMLGLGGIGFRVGFITMP